MLKKSISIAPLLFAMLCSDCSTGQTTTTMTFTSSASIATLPEPQGLRSQNSEVATSITFANTLSVPVSVNWKNFDGNEVFYKRLEPGESYVQQTYATHPWVVRETTRNEPVKILVATREPQTVLIQPTTVSRTTTTVTN